ncbi:glycosyltransferase family 1 protein [Paenibacillus sp. P22]|uniref:glycosyltransferase family 4 protein n=1 Tax=Paenibacillus sp. P22 TaxID=483908 RepID=UPI000434D7DC|nr:glycosyltransferase family 1 protein [Paenibacillus sp. P22]CDN43871.1 GDP-mannose-dependent alpha-mannosyltransferase [Paenibacillus sp. P22]
MRVALFTDTYVPQKNGAARTLGRLAAYLEKRGIEPLVLTPRCSADTEQSFVRSYPSIPFFLYPECRIAVPNPISLRAELDRFRPDLIHLATPFNIGLSGLLYARKNGIPHVASYHTHFDRYLAYYGLQHASRLYWRYAHWFHRTCAATFVPSRETLFSLYRHQFGGLRLWQRGVDCGVFRPELRSPEEVRCQFGLPEKKLALYVGRLALEKDLATLAAVMNGLSGETREQLHLLVVGDGPLLPELRRQMPDNVTFAGYREGTELARLYASADLFLFPSSTETFGNVVLEAMASGLPVIGAEAGGVKELVRHGRSGLLCPPGDPASFIDALERLLARPEEAASMGEAGRREALGRSWDQVLGGIVDQYEEILLLQAESTPAWKGNSVS